MEKLQAAIEIARRKREAQGTPRLRPRHVPPPGPGPAPTIPGRPWPRSS